MNIVVDRWTCKHFGHEKLSTEARQTGKRTNNGILPSACKMSINLAFDQRQQLYVIRKSITKHNHPQGPEFYSHYVDNCGDLQQQTALLLEHGANPTLVADNLNRRGLQIRAKDLYNIKHKLKFKGTLCIKLHLLIIHQCTYICHCRHSVVNDCYTFTTLVLNGSLYIHMCINTTTCVH